MLPAAVAALAFWATPHAASLPEKKQPVSIQELTILFFTAPWCGPCKAVSPVLERFARKHRGRVKLVPVDYDHAADEARRWEVEDIPVVIVLSAQGKLLLRADGAARETATHLEASLEALLKSSRQRKKP
jgi:thioredoxin-like negative regulator of GroEL